MEYTIKLQGQQDITVTKKGNKTLLNGNETTPDLNEIKTNRLYHIVYKGQSVSVEILSWNRDEKTMKALVNGIAREISIHNQFDNLLHSLGLDNMLTNKVNDIKAPMPGLVLSIKISIGDSVKKGDPILILEAMKMENIIKSPGDGIIKNIKVAEKQAVDKNQVLIELE